MRKSQLDVWLQALSPLKGKRAVDIGPRARDEAAMHLSRGQLLVKAARDEKNGDLVSSEGLEDLIALLACPHVPASVNGSRLLTGLVRRGAAPTSAGVARWEKTLWSHFPFAFFEWVQRHPDALQRALAEGAEGDADERAALARYPSGATPKTPLSIAVAQSCASLVRALLDAGAHSPAPPAFCSQPRIMTLLAEAGLPDDLFLAALPERIGASRAAEVIAADSAVRGLTPEGAFERILLHSTNWTQIKQASSLVPAGLGHRFRDGHWTVPVSFFFHARPDRAADTLLPKVHRDCPPEGELAPGLSAPAFAFMSAHKRGGASKNLLEKLTLPPAVDVDAEVRAAVAAGPSRFRARWLDAALETICTQFSRHPANPGSAGDAAAFENLTRLGPLIFEERQATPGCLRSAAFIPFPQLPHAPLDENRLWLIYALLVRGTPGNVLAHSPGRAAMEDHIAQASPLLKQGFAPACQAMLLDPIWEGVTPAVVQVLRAGSHRAVLQGIGAAPTGSRPRI